MSGRPRRWRTRRMPASKSTRALPSSRACCSRRSKTAPGPSDWRVCSSWVKGSGMAGAFGAGRREANLQRQELRGLQGAARESGEADGALEVVELVHANADGGAAGALRSELDAERAIEAAIDIAAKFLAIVDGGDVVPAAELVKMLAIEERFFAGARAIEGIETPLAVDDADFEEHAVIGVVAGGGILFEMKPALLDVAAIGAEDGFPGVGRGAGERMDVEKESVVHAVKLDGFAARGIDEARVAGDGHGAAADFVEPIEGPDFLRGSVGRRGRKETEDEECEGEPHADIV